MAKKQKADDKFKIDIIIETPQGSRNKFKFDEKKKRFKLSGVLTAGSVFPYDFGYVPDTQGEDGDPLDILILMDEPAFAGCLIPARLIGVIEAQQTETDGDTNRNDRLIAVAQDSHTHHDLKSLDQITPRLLDEIEHFFVSYTQMQGKKFKPLGRQGPERAMDMVKEGRHRHKKK